MATLFYEPSTRTRLSFESAMHRLGGAVISSRRHARQSSAAKGESLADTVRVVGAYADLIVVRHPRDGAARVAAEYAPCPVINAGDGSREHPTQTLCDLYILRRKKGHLRGLTVAHLRRFEIRTHRPFADLCARPLRRQHRGRAVQRDGRAGLRAGTRRRRKQVRSFDGHDGRAASSLAGGLDALYLTPNAPHQMALFTSDMPLENALPAAAAPVALDAFYVTRLQRERMAEQGSATPASTCHFDVRALKTSRTHEAVVMHPLPRTDELAYELDSDPRAVYFEQAAAGVPVRMALIAWLLEQNANRARAAGRADACRFASSREPAPRCPNPELHQPPRRSLPGAALSPGRARPTPPRCRLRCEFCERELKIEFVGHARTHRYYRFDETSMAMCGNWIEEGSLAVFESVKQAEEGGYEPYRRGPQREIMNADEVAAACGRSLAEQMIADLPDLASVTIVGVVSRGAMLAMRLRDLIEAQTDVRPPCAALDVYRRRRRVSSARRRARTFRSRGSHIVLVDDVINSGWTVQRAMTALWQRGRPAAVKLAVLIDRGHRAVPIRPNYVGKNIPTARAERVQVRLAARRRRDPAAPKSHDRVVIYSMVESLKEARGRRMSRSCCAVGGVIDPAREIDDDL